MNILHKFKFNILNIINGANFIKLILKFHHNNIFDNDDNKIII